MIFWMKIVELHWDGKIIQIKHRAIDHRINSRIRKQTIRSSIKASDRFFI